VALVHAARAAGVPERTAQRWLARYREGGLVGLAAPQRSDRGGRRMPDDLVAVIEGMALRRPRPSAATVHRRAVQVAERNGWRAPSYATVHAIVRALDPRWSRSRTTATSATARKA
jgi:putative transposase